jgi:hypothetical protein
MVEADVQTPAAVTANPATPVGAGTQAVGGVASRIQSSSAVASSAVVRSSAAAPVSSATPVTSSVAPTTSSAVTSSARAITSSSVSCVYLVFEVALIIDYSINKLRSAQLYIDSTSRCHSHLDSCCLFFFLVALLVLYLTHCLCGRGQSVLRVDRSWNWTNCRYRPCCCCWTRCPWFLCWLGLRKSSSLRIWIHC